MPKVKVYTEKIAVSYTPEQVEQIQTAADRIGVPMAVYIRIATIEKLKQDKNE